MAPAFTVNAHRRDPYKNYKFRIRDENNNIVLGVSKVGSLKRTTEVVKHRNGNDNSHDLTSPGRSTFEGVTLERGITHSLEFERWANRIHSWAGDKAMDLKGFRMNLTLEVLNEKGHTVLRYNLYGCWVSEFTALPDLDANANAVAIESIKLELEGWDRDTDTTEPDESSDVPGA